MKNKKFIITMVSLFIFIMLIGGVSYSYFIYNKDVADVSIETGNITINFNNVTNNVNSLNLVPQSNNIGMLQSNYIDFTIAGSVDSEPILYEIEIMPKDGNTLDTRYVKVYLTDQSDNVLAGPFLYNELYNALKTGGKGLYQELIEPESNETLKNYSQSYRLRMWIDESFTSVSNSNFSFSINLYAVNQNLDELQRREYNYGDGRIMYQYHLVGSIDNMPNPIRDGYVFDSWNTLNDNYEQIEYLEAPGGTTIDLGIPGGNDNLRLEIKYAWAELPQTGEYAFVIRSYVNEEINTTRLLQYGSSITYASVNMLAGGGSVSYSGTRTVGTIYDEVLEQGRYSVNGTVYTRTVLKGNVLNRNISLFNYTSGRIRLYEFKIYDNGVLIRHFIPCRNKSNQALGIIDIVNNVFYSKTSGNADFTTSNVSAELTLESNIYMASWDQIPILVLSKETYLEQDLSTWTATDATVTNGEATLNSSNSELFSGYIPVNGAGGKVVADVYPTVDYQDSGKGQIYYDVRYYDANYNPTYLKNTNTGFEYNLNGFSFGRLDLNEWNNNLVSANYNGSDNTKYIVFRFHGRHYGAAPYKIRNVKIYGKNIPNSFYFINVDTLNDDSIVSLKYAKGIYDVSYFENNGAIVSNNQIRVTENGTYTIYAKDNYGNEVVETIDINKII